MEGGGVCMGEENERIVLNFVHVGEKMGMKCQTWINTRFFVENMNIPTVPGITELAAMSKQVVSTLYS